MSCLLNLIGNDYGLTPLVKLLQELKLPIIPTSVTDFEAEGDFDWLDAEVRTKRTLGQDMFIGFDVYPDPHNSSLNYLVFGVPKINSQLKT
jgi:hypothetical protein